MAVGMIITRRSLLGFVPKPSAAAAGPVGNGVAAIADNCMELSGITCRACAGACPVSAINFAPRLGGGAIVTISAELCTGCADCLPRCPVGAIAVRSRVHQREVV